MAESINNDNDLLSYINEDFITNNPSKNDLNDEIYSNYIKTENTNSNKNNNPLGLTEKRKIELAQASIYNSITNNYNQNLPLSPPQDNDINSPNNEILFNSQNVNNQTLNMTQSPSMELEALSPSSIGSDVNDINNKSDEQNLFNLTQIYQNNGLIPDSLINTSLLSYTNPELISNSALLNAMCTDENNKSQLFPQVFPNTNIPISSSTYINDTLNPLSAVNIPLPTDTDIPVTLNPNLTLPTVTVPSNNIEFTVPQNTINLNNSLATTTGLDITTLQTLSPLALNGPLTVASNNAMNSVNSSTIISTTTVAPATAASTVESIKTTNATTSVNTSSAVSSVTTNPPLSSTLDLSSIKSSVNETLELTKKLSQANGNSIERKPIDVTDILKSDVAASCLNLLKGSKGKPGRKKKCLQSTSDNTNTNSNTKITPSTNIDSKTFPLLSTLNANNDASNTDSTNANSLLTAQSVKFPIIKPKSLNEANSQILPLAPSTTKSNSINCFSSSSTKPINSTLLRPSPTPILPNGNAEKTNTNSQNNQVKTAYQKRQERLLKNREAAHLSRKRKREQLHMLETHAQELIAENQTLKLKVIELEQLNEKLIKENELLKSKMGMGVVSIKKENEDETSMPEMPNDIYNLYINSEALINNTTNTSTQNKSSNKNKQIGIVFMVLLFSFSLFTFPLSIFYAKENTEVNKSLISSFMNKLSDFSLSSISPDNTGKIISNSYEQEKPYLLDSGHYEISQPSEVSTISGERNINDDHRKENEHQLVHIKKSRKIKNNRHSGKSKQKRNTTYKKIKKNYEYTSIPEISSLMSLFHPKNVDLDKESLKQMSLLQHWIVEGFCSIHENHTYAKDPSNVKDIIKIYNTKENNEESTDLTVKNNNDDYYDYSKDFSKEIPWNMKQFIKFYPDTTYFYSPKLVQLFPLSNNDIIEPTIPIINRLQPNNTAENVVTDDDNTTITPSSSYYSEKTNESDRKSHQSSTKSEDQDRDNIYHLPLTNKPKMAIITNIESDDIDEESNSYLMIDFEIKGARLIEN